MRPSFIQLWMQTAELISQRSTCERLKVGCVITSQDNKQLWGLGYNGDASGENNVCQKDKPGACGHDCHAEPNAMINYYGPKQAEKNLYCTHLPCVPCAKYIINFGNVKTVYFKNFHRDDSSINLFEKHGIKVEHLS
jgi:dCMP deaminase